MRSGRIPVPDLIKICTEAQSAVTRGAEAIEGRKGVHPGPTTETIRQECTLELVGITHGSPVAVLQFDFAAKKQPRILFPDQQTFGGEAIAGVATAIKSLGNGNSSDVPDSVLSSIYNMGAVFDSKRVSEVKWVVPGVGRKRALTVTINRKVRDRVAQRLSAPRVKLCSVDGVLGMGDFKPGDLRCRIDPPYGPAVPCSFTQEHEETVARLLRKEVRVTGLAHMQPYSDKIDSFEIESIDAMPVLFAGQGRFFAGDSLESIVRAQKVDPYLSTKALEGGIPADEDVDSFLEEIYSRRG